MDAVRFIKQLYCLDDNLQFLQGAAAAARFCPTSDQTAVFPAQHPGLFKMTGFAHHPYELTFAPNRPPPFRDRWVTIGNLPDLHRLLRRIFQRYGQPIPGGKRYVPLYLTEFGYQTKPPDPLGVSVARQAAYLNQSEYIAWRDPVVRTLAQFLLVDDGRDPGHTRRAGSGLGALPERPQFRNGRHKPSYDAYRWRSTSAAARSGAAPASGSGGWCAPRRTRRRSACRSSSAPTPRAAATAASARHDAQRPRLRQHDRAHATHAATCAGLAPAQRPLPVQPRRVGAGAVAPTAAPASSAAGRPRRRSSAGSGPGPPISHTRRSSSSYSSVTASQE